MTVQHECELILAVPGADDLPKVPRSAVWQGLAVRFQANTRLTDVYWDTPDHRLTQAGWAIRLRVAGREASLQAKSLHASDASGVNLREEFRQRARVNFNGILATLEAGPVSLLIADILDRPILDIELQPLFAATRMRRTYKVLANPLAYLMLDTGAIHRPGQAGALLGEQLTPFFRFELEGDPGARDQLLQWAQSLAAEIGAEITPISKFELGWQALGFADEELALAHAAASRHPLAVDRMTEPASDLVAATPATAAPGESAAAGEPPAAPAGKVPARRSRAARGGSRKSGGRAKRPQQSSRSRRSRASKSSAPSEAAATAAAGHPDDRSAAPQPAAVAVLSAPTGASPVAGSGSQGARPPDGLNSPPWAGGSSDLEALPPVVAHRDLGGSLVVTAEPIDAVLDDACHDPVTNELKALEEWPIEFRERCVRRAPADENEFISQLGHLLRRAPDPDSRSDWLTRLAGAIFDVTIPIHRLEPRFRGMLLSLAQLAGADLPSAGKGNQRWLALRDRIVYHGLPEFDGRQAWMMGLAMASLAREQRNAETGAWRRLTFDERQDALRLGALLKLSRDFLRKVGVEWVPAYLDLRHGRPVLLVEEVGLERRRLDLRSAGRFWREVFGEGLSIRRRTRHDGPEKLPPKVKLRPLDRKRSIDLFCGQNTGDAIAQVLAHQQKVFEKQEAHLKAARGADPARTLDHFATDPLIEVIHDYRVALRRLRSYCRLFELPLGRNAVRRMADTMQRLADPTSNLRQIDVLIETAQRDYQAGCFRTAGGGDPAPLFDWLLERRAVELERFWQTYDRSQTTALRERMTKELQPERWCWVDRLSMARPRRAGDREDFDPSRQGGAGRSRRAQQAPIEVFAAGALMQALSDARVLFVAARPDPLHCPCGDLHAVRIAVKKLRYGFELFAPLMGEPTNSVIDIGKKLQDQLGDINDCEANCHALEALLAAPPAAPAAVLQPAEVWTVYTRKRIHETRLHLVETWPRLFGRTVVKRLLADWWM
ncbi:MAG: CHAD domain-containing protein [Planctomycetota bacterium]